MVLLFWTILENPPHPANNSGTNNKDNIDFFIFVLFFYFLSYKSCLLYYTYLCIFLFLIEKRICLHKNILPPKASYASHIHLPYNTLQRLILFKFSSIYCYLPNCKCTYKFWIILHLSKKIFYCAIFSQSDKVKNTHKSRAIQREQNSFKNSW